MTLMRRGTGAGGSDIDNFCLPPIIGPWLHQAIADVKKNAMILNVMRWQRSPSSETLDTMPPGRGFGTMIGAMVGDSSASSLAVAGDTPKYLRIQIRDMVMGIEDEGRAWRIDCMNSNHTPPCDSR